MIKIFFSLVAFCIYYLLVQFGSIFTISFGFASAIWPLSGVILGLYFLYGRSILVGSFLASLLTLQQESLFADLPSYVIFILASISVLQFIIAKQLVVRFCTLPLNIRKLVSIVKFLLLTGPLTVLMSTSLFALTLTLSLDISFQTLTHIGLVKFVGDLLSILFIAPIFLFLKANIFVRKTKHSLAAVLVSLLSFSLISLIYILASNNNFALKEREFATSTEPFIEKFNVIKTTIKNNITALNGLFQASEEVTRLEFETYANKLIDDEFNVIALAWLPLISHQKREKFEAELASQGFANTSIKKKTEQGLIISPNKSFYLPLYYISNLTANKSAVGLDALSHPILKDIVNKMIKGEKQVISPLVYLNQHQDKYTTADVYYPIYKNSPPDQKSTLQGLVKVNFELNLLLSDLHRNMKTNTFTYQLNFGDENIVTHPNFKLNSIFSHQYDVNILDKKGQLSFASTPEFELSLINWQILIIMIFGSIIGIICVSFVFFIVTFNYSLTRKIRERTTKLIKKNKELTNANQAKNLFLANISHEYRTPLNAIMGFSEIALREIEDKHALDYFTKIEESSKILLSIVNDVLDTSKIQAGEIKLEKRKFSPSAVTQTVIDMLIEKAINKSITVNKSFTSNFGLWVEGDDTRFKQIIINLLNNAIKFTDKGTISISGDSDITDDKSSILTLVIRDTGIGINEEDQKHLFTPFTQATRSSTKNYGGTGLGLAIVKQLCSLMGGDVTLTSQTGIGSTITVKITLPKIEKPIEVYSSSPRPSVCSGYKKTKILVVEDNKINQLIVGKQLSFKGITCDFADDGLLALSYLENTIPDLILMDLQMPNMDGFTTSSLIKKNIELQHIPIVILSASVSKEDKEQASVLGIHDFINKPCYQEDLVFILDKYLKSSINTNY